MKKIKGILFDKDGTLLDFNRTWIQPYRQAASYLHSRFGSKADPDTLMERGGFIAETERWQPDSLLASGCNREIIEFWADVIGQPIKGEDEQAIESIFTLAPDAYIPIVDDIAVLFAELRQGGIKLGLATMDNEANAHHMLQAVGIAALFDFVCGADSGHGRKPEPGMVLAFCQACGLESDQVLMVGDSPRDLNMGRNAGVALAVGVLTGTHREVELAPCADIVLENIAGLKAVIDTDCRE